MQPVKPLRIRAQQRFRLGRRITVQRAPGCSNIPDHGRVRRPSCERTLKRPRAVRLRHNQLRRITFGQDLNLRFVDDIRSEGDIVAAFNHPGDGFFRPLEPVKMGIPDAVLVQQIAGGQRILIDGMQHHRLAEARG
ncbi:hypothetical protein D3C76_1483290 [compost metagenome]